MEEKIYKIMRGAGALNIVLGVISLVVGIAAGVLLIISGVTLATMNVYDERKWLMLANIYTQATSEPLRQRALTGWALTSHPETAFFKSQQETFVRLTADEQTRAELPFRCSPAPPSSHRRGSAPGLS